MTHQKRSARSAIKKKGYQNAKTSTADGLKFFRAYLDGVGSTILRPAFVAPHQSCCPAYGLNFFSPLSAQRLLLSQLHAKRVVLESLALQMGSTYFLAPRPQLSAGLPRFAYRSNFFLSFSIAPALAFIDQRRSLKRRSCYPAYGLSLFFFTLSLSLVALHLAFIASRPQLSAGNRFNSHRISK